MLVRHPLSHNYLLKCSVGRFIVKVPCSLPSVRMFIGQGLSLEARHAAQAEAERRSANTAMAPASAAAAAAAERASSASPPFFALSPPAKMDSIASPPTPASADGPSSSASIAVSLAPLVYAEDFIEGGRWWGSGALAGR